MTIGEFMQRCDSEMLVQAAAALMAIGCDQLARMRGAELSNDTMLALSVRFMAFAKGYLDADVTDLIGPFGK